MVWKQNVVHKTRSTQLIANLSEKDRATATWQHAQKFDEDRPICKQTDRQTDEQTHSSQYFAPLSGDGRNKQTTSECHGYRRFGQRRAVLPWGSSSTRRRPASRRRSCRRRRWPSTADVRPVEPSARTTRTRCAARPRPTRSRSQAPARLCTACTRRAVVSTCRPSPAATVAATYGPHDIKMWTVTFFMTV